MELTNMSYERKKQIAEAIFDRLARKMFLAEDTIEIKIKTKDLDSFARKLGYDLDSLNRAIVASCARINKTKILAQQSQKDEMTILLSVVKFEILESCISPKDYKREFSKIVSELNNQNLELKLTTKELLKFIIPNYIEMVKETFGLNL